MSHSGTGRNGSSSGNRAGQHFSTRGHRLGGGGGGGGHPHQTRSQATAYVSQRSRQPSHIMFIEEDDDNDDEYDTDIGHSSSHGYHDAMHGLADTMAELDSMLGSGPQGESTRSAFGPGFPFNDTGGIPGFDALHIGMGTAFDDALEGAFSHPIFSGNGVAHGSGAHTPGVEPGVHRTMSCFGEHFPFGPTSSTHVHIGGFGRGEDLPFHAHPTPSRRPGYVPVPTRGGFPVEFEPHPLPADYQPTESSEQRINNFVARNTEPLTAANTTSTTNTDCPVCMENAAAHPCVKIKGIQGCEHMIGRDCLKEFLKQRPDDEKTCPLCRAVWLAENGVWQDSDQWSERIAQANLGHRFARW